MDEGEAHAAHKLKRMYGVICCCHIYQTQVASGSAISTSYLLTISRSILTKISHSHIGIVQNIWTYHGSNPRQNLQSGFRLNLTLFQMRKQVFFVYLL